MLIHDDNILRNVKLGATGFTLLTWDTGRRCNTGQYLLGYRLTAPDGFVLFEAEDYGCAPSECIDSDTSLRSLLSFLALRPGDTDEDYFAAYTPEQLAFCERDAERLSDWSWDPREFGNEHGDETFEALPFINMEGFEV